MGKTTLSLKLNGDVPLDLFAEAMGHFSALILSLTEDVLGPEKVDWEVARLEGGSALALIRGQHQEEEKIERVVHAYEQVGRALEWGYPIPYSEQVASHARGITAILNGQVTSIAFATDDYTASIDKHRSEAEQEAAQPDRVYSLGALTGIVGAIAKRPFLKLTLYDTLFDRAVTCYLEKSQEETARNIWGQRVTVTGMISRDPDTGKPIDVRQVTHIEVEQHSPPGSYKRAQGIIPWEEGSELSEEIIRRLRDDT
jgi:hypothetical protein